MHLSQVRHCRFASVRPWIRSFEGGSVTLDRLKDDIGVILMKNDKKRNAFTGKMMVNLEHVVSELEKSTPRAVILRGDGGHFCSGWDLSFVERVANPKDGSTLCHFIQDVTRRIQGLACPSVALIEGFAIGGGAELALSCDWRVMSARSFFELRQARMGVTTGNGGCLRLVQLVGRSRALELLLSGRRLDGEAALNAGLADHVISESSGDALSATGDWLRQMYGDVDKKVVHAMKRAVHDADPLNNDLGLLSSEAEAFASVWGGPVQLEILKNIRETLEKKKG